MYKQGKFYAIGATGFLYSLIIVDLYRKLEGSNVEIVRNVVYVFFFWLAPSRHVTDKKISQNVTYCIFCFTFIRI